MTRVMYVHGLESGPTGKKAKLLAEAGFDVTAVLMPCSQKYALRDPLIVVWAIVGLALIVSGALFSWLHVLGAVVVVFGAFFPVKALVTRRVLERSVAVQRRNLEETKPDVVLGSSFGGAVSLELLRRGFWRGTTVLLCPAHERVTERGWQRRHPGLAGLPEDVVANVLVVHGTNDETVPIEHSRRLVAGTRAHLICVDDDHRLTLSATAENLASWVALARSAATSR